MDKDDNIKVLEEEFQTLIQWMESNFRLK